MLRRRLHPDMPAAGVGDDDVLHGSSIRKAFHSQCATERDIAPEAFLNTAALPVTNRNSVTSFWAGSARWENHVPMMLTPMVFSEADDSLKFVVIVSADAEWRAVAELFSDSALERTPYGEFFYHDSGASRGVVMRGGWGKIDAAASAQYGISRWRPSLLVNLGTCGGILGQIERFETVLAERTVVYDITERMGDSTEAIRSYSTTIDLDWLGSRPLPSPARRSILVSADRDLAPADVPVLRRLYQAIAVDWESGAVVSRQVVEIDRTIREQ